ncbi:MAG: hypothetical protein M3Y84_08820 [Acidobacteriota bacterium]|nr:hypothetical protein [Acidobacteriota bacterium]
MKRSKRVLSKGKIYGFGPWADQVYAINQIMEETGEKSETNVLRDLIDEALAARRRKSTKPEVAKGRQMEGSAETLETIQTLLLKLIRQGETSLRIQDVSLALLQDTLAETRASRELVWEEKASALKEKGLNARQISERFKAHTDRVKDFAYSKAKEIKGQQE